MTDQEIVHILVSHQKISDDVQLTKLTDTTYKLADLTNVRIHAVKVVPANVGRGIRGILQAYCRTKQIEELMQPVTDIVHEKDYVIALLDWIDGDSLKGVNRNLLPKFFTKLREWHEKNINADAIYSPYTNEKYESIDDFVVAEATFHLKSAKLADFQKQSIDLLSGLRYGFITVLHGDIHPGNIQFDGNRFTLLDPEYVHCGINLLDLDYIEYDVLPEEETPWWAIVKEAKQSLHAYFAKDTKTRYYTGEIMQSVKTLNLLRSISNSLIYKTGNTEQVVEQYRKFLQTTE
ncbi:MAG: phosphotransferase [Spirochaetales bacterium]|jgi:thiamine kinase-like enzyme|nr:phosphotransferase [Spirochaetales bacterium]